MKTQMDLTEVVLFGDETNFTYVLLYFLNMLAAMLRMMNNNIICTNIFSTWMLPWHSLFQLVAFGATVGLW